jgi:23S rRNA (guanine745-N1)-methyltransferase
VPSAALTAAASSLRCPNCGAPLICADRALRCASGHSFDVARQGHVALLPPGRTTAGGDSSEMVAARDAFLGAGHFAPIAAAVTTATQVVVGTSTDSERCVVDLGAGTGYYLAALLEALPDWNGIALDASRPALRRAARAHPRIAAIACDVWLELPIQDASADLVVDVFAPRNGSEIARVLSDRGALVVVTPTPRHLHQLVPELGMLAVHADKQARLHTTLSPHLSSVSRRDVEFDMTLGHDDARALVAMGPSAHHVGADDVRRGIAQLPAELAVTASVIVETFRRGSSGRT